MFVHAVLRRCSAETLSKQRSLCSSLRMLLALVREHVAERRSHGELVKAYQVSMARVEAAHAAQAEYCSVLQAMDHLLLCLDSVLQRSGHVRASE